MRNVARAFQILFATTGMLFLLASMFVAFRGPIDNEAPMNVSWTCTTTRLPGGEAKQECDTYRENDITLPPADDANPGVLRLAVIGIGWELAALIVTPRSGATGATNRTAAPATGTAMQPPAQPHPGWGAPAPSGQPPAAPRW